MAELVLNAAVVLAVVLLGCGTVGIARLRRDGGGARVEAVRRATRSTLTRSVVAVFAALYVFLGATSLGIGRPALQMVPFVAGAAAAAGVGLLVFAALPSRSIDGEVATRSAALVRRGALSMLRRRSLTGLGLLWGSAVGAVLGAGVVSMPAPDGRFICTSLLARTCVAGGPDLFPGWSIGLPVLLGLALVGAGAALSLRRVAAAPVAAWADLAGIGEELRTSSARLVVLVAAAASALSLGMMLALAGVPLLNAETRATLTVAAAHDFTVLGGGLIIAGVLVGLLGVALVLLVLRAALQVARPVRAAVLAAL